MTPTETLVGINVQRLEVLRRGSKNGRDWTLYQVHGTFTDGGGRATALKTFDDLPLGPVKVELSPDPREQGWHIAKLPKAQRKSAGSSRTTSDLEARIERLERQMRAIIGDSELVLP